MQHSCDLTTHLLLNKCLNPLYECSGFKLFLDGEVHVPRIG